MAKLARLPGFDRSAETEADVRVPRLRTRFYAFLSYSHKDKELADWLHRELEKFRVPHALAGKLTANGVVPRRLTPIFRDQHDLSAGGDLAEEIKAALAASQFLVVLCSPTAAVSRWTNAEIESFKRTRPEGCVLAAVVAGEPFASDISGREKEECFPPALRYKYDRRGHRTAKRAEPLAADFRAGSEGRRLAFLKLVAGMLGVGLDELVQREQTRRHRHLAWLTAASIVGMAVTSTLAVTAFEARNAARDQRREAEGLVEFMVGDLRGKLEPIGRLDALDGVGSRVLAYYSKQDTAELSDAGLLQRSRALNLMAEVAYLRGNYSEAEGLYRQAAAGTEEAVRRSPDDTQRIFDHAQNVFWLGELARFQGHSDQAFAQYSEYRRLGDRLVELEPDNFKWRMESLYGRENVGIALYGQRKFAEAGSSFASALQPIASIASIDRGNSSYSKELATLLAWSADAERAQGKLAESTAVRQRQITLLNGMVAGGARDVEVRQLLIPAHQALGILLEWRGQLDASMKEFAAAVAEADQLIPVEPGNTLWRTLGASARLDLAKTLLVSNRNAEAQQQADKACATVAALRARDSRDSLLLSLQTACLTMRARLALQSGAANALSYAEQAVASSRMEHSGDSIKDRYVVAGAYRLLGDVQEHSGDRDAALSAWSKALAILPSGIAEKPNEMDEHAVILLRLGRAADARPLVSSLEAMGYRRLT